MEGEEGAPTSSTPPVVGKSAPSSPGSSSPGGEVTALRGVVGALLAAAIEPEEEVREARREGEQTNVKL